MKDKNEKRHEEKTAIVKMKKMFKATPIKNLEEKDIKIATAKKSKLGISVECPSCFEKVSKRALKQCDICNQEVCKDCLISGKDSECLCMNCVEE